MADILSPPSPPVPEGTSELANAIWMGFFVGLGVVMTFTGAIKAAFSYKDQIGRAHV